MSNHKIIDIANALYLVNDFNINGTTSNLKILANNYGELQLYSTSNSTNSSTGALTIFNGGLSINSTMNASSITQGGCGTFRGGISVLKDILIGGNIGLGTIASSKLSINGGFDASSGTVSNIILTNISSETLNITGITSNTLLITGLISSNSLYSSTSTIPNAFFTNISSSTLNITGLTTGDLLNTGIISTNSLTASTSTFPNSIFTNISSSTLNINGGITTASILNTGMISTNSLTVSTSTLSNAIITNISSGSFNVNNVFNANFNSNTIGSIFTSGGNVGVGTVSPSYKLDISGTLRVSNGSSMSIIQNNLIGDVLMIQNGNNTGYSTIDILDSSDNKKVFLGYSNTGASVLPGSGYLTSSTGVPIKIAAGNSIDYIILNASDNSISITTTTNSIDTVSGALKVSGGGSFSKNLYIGGDLFSTNGNIANISSNTLNASGITAGNINFTGSLYQNGSLYISSQWIGDTNGNIYYTNGNINGTLNSGYSTISNLNSTNISTGTLNASDITAGNINFTGSLYQNGNLYTSSQWLGDTNGNIYYTNGNINGTLNSGYSTISNLNSTNISTGTLNASGITAGNINFTGSLYQNGSLYTSSQWLGDTNGNIYYTNGDVGINTTSPSTNLDVNGSINATNILSTTSSIGTLLNTTKLIATGSINTIGSFIISGASASINGGINNNRCLTAGSGTQGAISIVNAGEARYHLYNAGLSREWLFGQKSNTNHDFTFTTLVAGVETDRMVIDINGNLGIGTASPLSRLQVTNAGATTSMIISNVTSGSTILELGIANTATELSSSARSGDSVIRTHTGANLIFQTSHSGAAHMIIVSTGSVGIGTTAPSSLLTVNGTFNATSSTIPNAVFTNISTGTINISTGITTASILNTGLISTNNLTATSSTFGNALFTNISSATLNISTSIISGLISTSNALFTNISTSTLKITSDSNLNNTNISGIVTITNSTSSTDSSHGSLIIYGGVGIGENLNISGNAIINGDLTVRGTTATINTSSLNIQDNMIVVNSAPAGLSDGGILVKRYVDGINSTSGTNYAGFFYKESSDEFTLALTDTDITSGSITLGNYLPLRANYINLQSTVDAIGIGSGGALTILGGASISKSIFIGGNLTAISSTLSNAVFTNISSATLNISTGITSGSILNTGLISTNNLTATSSTFSNAVFTNISSATLNISTGITTASVLNTGLISTNNLTATSSTLSNAVFTNISTGTINTSTGITTNSLLVTGLLSTNNLTATSSTLSNAVLTNISSATLNISTGLTTASILNTGLISTNNLTATTSTLGNAIFTNISTGTINISTGITTASVLNTGLISTNNLTATSSTLSNAVFTNISSSSINSTGLTTNNLLVTGLLSGANAYITTLTAGTLLTPNFSTTNISTDTINISTGLTSSSILNTGLISTNNLAATSSTLDNAIFTNISSATLNISTGITTASILNTGLISTNNLTATTSTLSNALFTNISSNTLTLTSNLNANYNSNTLGSIITTGGNIGIGTSSPSRKLTVNGTVMLGNQGSTQGSSSLTSSFIATGNQWIQASAGSMLISSSSILNTNTYNISGFLLVHLKNTSTSSPKCGIIKSDIVKVYGLNTILLNTTYSYSANMSSTTTITNSVDNIKINCPTDTDLYMTWSYFSCN